MMTIAFFFFYLLDYLHAARHSGVHSARVWCRQQSGAAAAGTNTRCANCESMDRDGWVELVAGHGVDDDDADDGSTVHTATATQCVPANDERNVVYAINAARRQLN